MSSLIDNRLAHIDAITTSLEVQLANAREVYNAGKEALLDMRDCGVVTKTITEKLIELEFNINLLEGLIVENRRSRATLVEFLEDPI